MSELAQIKVSTKFAIGSRQQVEIESSRHSEFVVVGAEQLRCRFFQVCSQEQRVARLKNASDRTQKLHACGSIEIPNGAAQEQHHQALAALAVRRHLQQSIQIFAFKTHTTAGINVTQFAFAHEQGGA